MLDRIWSNSTNPPNLLLLTPPGTPLGSTRSRILWFCICGYRHGCPWWEPQWDWPRPKCGDPSRKSISWRDELIPSGWTFFDKFSFAVNPWRKGVNGEVRVRADDFICDQGRLIDLNAVENHGFESDNMTCTLICKRPRDSNFHSMFLFFAIGILTSNYILCCFPCFTNSKSYDLRRKVRRSSARIWSGRTFSPLAA